MTIFFVERIALSVVTPLVGDATHSHSRPSDSLASIALGAIPVFCELTPRSLKTFPSAAFGFGKNS
jgi:hypothetical protein